MHIYQINGKKYKIPAEQVKRFLTANPTAKLVVESIQQLFEQRVAESPEHIAVVSDDECLSYRELNDRANRLAHFLSTHYHIQADDIIALMLDRSAEAIIGMLAVLKAGGAYMPIDADTPDARIDYMLRDAAPKALLTQTIYAEKLTRLAPALPQCRLDDDRLSEVSAAGNVSHPDLIANPHQLAYIIYTSGTTGNPKGVMIEQGNAVNFLYALEKKFNDIWPNRADRPTHYLWYANYVFDAHIYEIYPVLTAGHTLFIAKGDVRYDLKLLNAFIQRHGIEAACIPPILLDKNLILPLKLLSVVGDTTNQEVIDGYLKRGITIVNGYGPTETTVCSNVHCFASGDKNTVIGAMLSSYKAYIVNEQMQLLPDGAVGELYLAGAGVSRGYLNNPTLTAERFLINPFQTKQEKDFGLYDRIYKTGDLARKMADGKLEYLGRNDSQIKIRGLRVELAEIEARLAAYPGVKQAVVVAKQSPAAMTYLAAYYSAEQTIAADRLADYLGQFLPDYMVPAAYIAVDKFPMTVNGKLDRRALPEPVLTLNVSVQRPESECERQLLHCYAEILNLSPDEVSVDDNFFRLGGNSISAIKLTHRINQALNTHLNVSAIFSHNTVRKLANNLNTLQDQHSPITPITVNDAENQWLSFAQERLKFIDLYEEGGHAYHIPLVFKLNPRINLDWLFTAIKAVVHRHQILRSVIKTNPFGVHYQEVQDDRLHPLPIDTVTLTSKKALFDALSLAVNRPFNLSEQWPLKATVYRLHDETYMSIVVHHIAFDGWSGDIFIRDLLQAYQAQQNDGQPPDGQDAFYRLLPPLAVQYKDYALWQRQYLTGQTLAEQCAFWQRQLSGYETLNLPTDHPRPNQIDYRGATLNFKLDQSLSDRLKAAAKRLDVSLFDLLLSGYFILLSSYANQKDIIVGSPIANRHHGEIADTIGFFVNSLALRQHVDPESRLIDFVEQVAELTRQVQRYQDLPFEKLVDELGVKKDTSRHPIFQVLFSVQSFGGEQQDELSRLLEPIKDETELGYNVAKFDLSLIINDGDTCLSGLFNYATALFQQQTIAGYLSTYTLILSYLSTSALQPEDTLKIHQLPLLNKDDYQKVVHDWNQTPPVSANATLVERFEQQVKRTPDRCAVVFQDRQLTYRALDAAANRLAHYLKQEYCLTADSIVALALERSEQMIIAVLAVLKAGAAYVPLSPEAPKERISFIVEDTGAAVLLTHQRYCASFDYLADVSTIRREAIDEAGFTARLTAYDAVVAPDTTTEPHHLAYVIYTSGTTGNPKGVMVEHRNVVHLFNGAERLYGFNESDVWTLFHSYVFDFSVWELWGALLFGGKLVVPDQEQSYDIGQFYQLCRRQGVTILNQTPSVFYQFIDSAVGAADRITSLRYVIFGGEALNAAQLKPWYDIYPDDAPYLVNMYGITETTVFATSPPPLTADDLERIPSIGRPLDGYTGYVLDEFSRPLPIGAVGELYLGGGGVARGYLNNAELSRRRFIDNPFQTEQEKALAVNGRLYKSGDLVRYRPNGQLEYLGRNDFQVKIRGFRIEPEEIAARLSLHTDIRQSVVLTVENHLSEKALVAYYVCERELDKPHLIDHLAAYVPGYMIPDHFIRLSRLPLTINGKLDRRNLPQPELNLAREYVAPTNALERELCQLFGTFLERDPDTVGALDDYFALGGNSIIATRLIYDLNRRFDARLKIVDLFMHASVRQLAALIEKNRQGYQSIVALNAMTATASMFMIHPGGGGCEAYLSLAKGLEQHYRCYGVEPYNFYHQEKIDSLPQLAERYLNDIDRQQSNRNAGYVLLGWSLGGLLALEIAALLEARGVTDIQVYLLDTILNDRRCGLQVAPPDDRQIKSMIKDYGDIDFAAAKALLLTENRLINQNVSGRLKHARLTLFKAMQNRLIRHESAQYHYDTVVEHLAQLTIVEIPDASHDDILTKGPTQILAKLLADVRNHHDVD
jgi:amino acid adenylation domain-containing protein